MTTHDVAPTVLPVPPDFPVTWANPKDEKLTLRRDRQHTPTPITPLTGWISENYWAKGSSAGYAAIRVPRNLIVRRINTYYYNGSDPMAPPESTPEAWECAEKFVAASIPTFGRRWDDEWLPEVKEYHARWEAFDLSGATVDELLDHLNWTLATYVRLWHIHMELAPSRQAGPSRFQDLYMDLFGGGPLDAFKLLQGVDNESVAAGAALWALSRVAKSDPDLTVLFRETDSSRVMEALTSSKAGKRFLIEFRAYLNEYGKRSDTIIELADPSWVEDPAIAIENLKHYLSDDARDPVEQRARLVAEREQAVADARDKIAGYPEAVRSQFELLLTAAQEGQRTLEDHNRWIDQMGTHQVRRVFLECGRRLAAAGAIVDRDDVFYLTGDEVIDTLSAGLRAPDCDFTDRVQERKAEMEYWSQIDPPAALGTVYGPPPENSLTRASGRFVGAAAPATSSERPDVLIGNSGSSGVVTGIARVIVKLSDAGRLGPGEILVTPTTSPPWTPLFATAGGIVTDTGGPLSHCAIVAREYGIPAVVGTRTATAAIKDGQTIEVDGDAGEVRIV